MTASSKDNDDDLIGENPPIEAEILVSSNLLNWNPVSFLIITSMGEIDLSCLWSDVIVAMLFVCVCCSSDSAVASVVLIEEVSLEDEGGMEPVPRIPCMALMLKSERGSTKKS